MSQNSEIHWMMKVCLIVMRQSYQHHWKAVLNLINNSLINCAGTNSSNFTMILTFYRSKSHSFQNPKKTGFPGFFFSVTRNPGFKILLRIGNTRNLVLWPYYQVLGVRESCRERTQNRNRVKWKQKLYKLSGDATRPVMKRQQQTPIPLKM